MRLASFYDSGQEQIGIVFEAKILPIKAINSHFHTNFDNNIFNMLQKGQLAELTKIFTKINEGNLKFNDNMVYFDNIKIRPLYKHPSKIWGIGLNYKEHAEDLSEKVPEQYPGSFMKPSTTIIGHNDTIRLPRLSEVTTGEAELGIVIGKKARNVSRDNWLSVVAGFTNIIDMTAEDILRKNPRFLTLSKSFDTFFSFGPYLITPDEIPNIMTLNVATVINDVVYKQNSVSNMTFPPDYLVAFHSEVMTLNPGDVISTGTPGAVKLKHSDKIACKIQGFPILENYVIDEKRS